MQPKNPPTQQNEQKCSAGNGTKRTDQNTMEARKDLTMAKSPATSTLKPCNSDSRPRSLSPQLTSSSFGAYELGKIAIGEGEKACVVECGCEFFTPLVVFFP